MHNHGDILYIMDASNLVSKEFLNHCRGHHLDPLWFLDVRIIKVFKALRNYFGPKLFCNDYDYGFSQSGFRSQIDKPIGGVFSQHKYGRAMDLHGIPKDAILEYIKKNELGVTTIEKLSDTPTWLHVDFRFTGKNDLLIVSGK